MLIILHHLKHLNDSHLAVPTQTTLLQKQSGGKTQETVPKTGVSTMMDVLLPRGLLHSVAKESHLTWHWFHPALGKWQWKVKGTPECHEHSLANPERPGDKVFQAITIYLFWGLELFPTAVL